MRLHKRKLNSLSAYSIFSVKRIYNSCDFMSPSKKPRLLHISMFLWYVSFDHDCLSYLLSLTKIYEFVHVLDR